MNQLLCFKPLLFHISWQANNKISLHQTQLGFINALQSQKFLSYYASLALKGIAYCACGIIRVLSVLFGAKFSSAQSLSRLWLFATPWTAAHQASLSITNSQSPPKPRSIESVIPSHPLSSPSPPTPNLSQHQSFPVSQLFTSSSQSIGVSASTSVLPMNTQDWSPLKSILRWPGWISLQSKGLSRVFSNTTVQKHQFFGTQLSLQSNPHMHTWLLVKP